MARLKKIIKRQSEEASTGSGTSVAEPPPLKGKDTHRCAHCNGGCDCWNPVNCFWCKPCWKPFENKEG